MSEQQADYRASETPEQPAVQGVDVESIRRRVDAHRRDGRKTIKYDTSAGRGALIFRDAADEQFWAWAAADIYALLDALAEERGLAARWESKYRAMVAASQGAQQRAFDRELDLVAERDALQAQVTALRIRLREDVIDVHIASPAPDAAAGEAGDEIVPSMLRVNGQRFYCRCGVGVFGHNPKTDIFACNGCGTEYQGDTPAAGRTDGGG